MILGKSFKPSWSWHFSLQNKGDELDIFKVSSNIEIFDSIESMLFAKQFHKLWLIHAAW